MPSRPDGLRPGDAFVLGADDHYLHFLATAQVLLRDSAAFLWAERQALLDGSGGAGVNPWATRLAQQRVPSHLRRFWRLVMAAPSQAELERAMARLHPVTLAALGTRAADLVVTPAPTLAAALEPDNPHVCVIPNALDLAAPCFQDRRQPHAGVIIGWAGAGVHRPDLDICLPALRALLEEYDGQDGRPWVRLMLGGEPLLALHLLRQLPGTTPFLQRLKKEAPPRPVDRVTTIESEDGRYLWRPFMADVEGVPGMFRDIDIGIVPLERRNAVSACKSDLKGLEMAAMGVPCVASPHPAYQEWRGKPGTGCILLDDNEPGSWYQALKRLIEDPDLRERMSKEARAFAETRSIDRWAPKWLEAWEETLRRKR